MALIIASKGQYGTPVLFFQARGDQTHDPLMPVGVVNTNAGTGVLWRGLQRVERFFMHARFDGPAFVVHAVKFARQLQGLGFVVSSEALYAYAHVGQTTSRIDARAHGKAHVKGTGATGVASGHGK